MRYALILLLACGGCGVETCTSFDLDCFLRNLTLLDEEGGAVPITIVKREAAEAVMGAWSDPTIPSENRDLGPAGPTDSSVPVDLRIVDFSIPTLAMVPLGCFIDKMDARDLSASATWSPSMSREMCAQFCAGYPYFGLQDGSWCYCGNSYGAYGVAPPGDCYMSCSGTTAQTCGGYLRNAVYGKSAGPPPDLATAPVVDMAGAATSGGTSGGTTGGTSGGTSGGGGGPTPVAEQPTIDLDTSNATIAPDMPAMISAPYHDGNKCTPAICMSMCRSGARCASVMACIPPRRDGIVDGVWRSTLGTRVEPADAPVLEALMPLIGVGSVDCKDPIEDMKAVERGEPNPNLSGAVAAAMVTMQLTIAKKQRESSTTASTGGTSGGSSGGTTGGNQQCSAYTSPGCSGATCNYRACASASASGSCSAWYETSRGGRINCAGCQNCESAATSVYTTCCPRQP